MGVGQAFAVAFGLVFLVLGWLYVAARNYGENPDAPQPIWWRVVRGGVAIVMVAFFLYVGTLVLTNGAPNYFFASGAATFCYGEAVNHASGRRFKPSILRLRWLVFALAFSLFAVGCTVEGGPVGILGAILSVIVAAFWWWLLVKIPLD